jgi:TRAP-type C4-dicarboxylate transport system substrate-binding protein
MTAVVAAALAASGCGHGGNGDKAGASKAPTTLRLGAGDDADQPDARFVRHFAKRVQELSGGSLVVQIDWDAAGQDVADYEARVARMVQGGRLDLGWIGSRAWEGLGVTSFKALQAPFLVTDRQLLNEIATGPIATRMLAGLQARDLVGLALVPDRLRYPFGARHAFASPRDFEGARLRVFPSRASEQLVRALGAQPVHISGDATAEAVASGAMDGAEASLGTNSPDEGESFLAANVALFPKALTLFGNRESLAELHAEQAAAIRRAARDTAAFAAAKGIPESVLLRRFCNSGPVTVVNATSADLSALRRRAQPVYDMFERDPQTRALISAIRSLGGGSTPAARPAPGCTAPTSAAEGPAEDPSVLDGTYHWRITPEGAQAAGGARNDPDVGTVGRMTLRDGRWLMGDVEPEKYSGSYEIRGPFLVFDWVGRKLTFRFRRDEDGGLRLRPIPPIDRGDAVVMAGGPWRRVGPPVRDIPPLSE